MPRKTQDPRKIALMDKIEKHWSDCEKGDSRCKRAWTRMEKCRRALVRLHRQLARLDNPNSTPPPTASPS